MKKDRTRWTLLIAANVLFCCVLGLYQSTSAAPGAGRQPFSNAVEQRGEMVRQLKEVNALLREQNALLRSGRLQVVISEKKND